MRNFGQITLYLLAMLVTASCAQQTPPTVDASELNALASGTLLRDTVGLYPRVIQLAHNGANNGRILASVVTFENNNGLGAIYESTDGGESFTQVGTVADPDAAGGKGLCCSTLYEVPQRVGDTPAGTLFWAASVGQDSGPNRRMALRIWKSNDVGRSWNYLSSCAVSPNAGGLWEPEFSVDGGGRLVCHFADETEQPNYSQFLARTVSRDGGKTWGPKEKTVASTNSEYRPGMPIVRKLPDNTYLMTYEICALPGQYDCAVFLRTSKRGNNWGEVTNLGRRVSSNTGRYFTHTPVIALSPDGKILMSGQLLQNRDGSTAEGNGTTLMVNLANGEGTWYEIPAPVEVPDAYNNFCPNYSSPLLPLDGGSKVLEIATDRDEVDCRAYYATGPVPDTFAVNDSTLGSANGQFDYSDLWSYGTGCAEGCFGGDDHFTNVAGAEVTLHFYGSQVTLYGARDPGHGMAEVSIDGKKKTLVDYYAPSRQNQEAVYTSPSLRLGQHTLTLKLTGTKNPASRNTFVTVDRADVRY